MVDTTTKDLVRERASHCCEYCRLPQEFYELTFHVEHIVATQHKKDDSPENLALACDRCNLYKGANLSAIDPETDKIVTLFNPRTQKWSDHFGMVGPEIIGLTPQGRATASLLNMNSERRLILRRWLLKIGKF